MGFESAIPESHSPFTTLMNISESNNNREARLIFNEIRDRVRLVYRRSHDDIQSEPDSVRAVMENEMIPAMLAGEMLMIGLRHAIAEGRDSLKETFQGLRTTIDHNLKLMSEEKRPGNCTPSLQLWLDEIDKSESGFLSQPHLEDSIWNLNILLLTLGMYMLWGPYKMTLTQVSSMTAAQVDSAEAIFRPKGVFGRLKELIQGRRGGRPLVRGVSR